MAYLDELESMAKNINQRLKDIFILFMIKIML